MTSIASSLVTLLLLAGLCGCSPGEETELAPYMSRLQTYSQKLGFSVQAQNRELALFYLHEVEETFEEVEEQVPVHDGQQIAQLVESMMKRKLTQLGKDLKGDSWPAARRSYARVIETCNRCHAATEHEFLFILPASGAPPFNQRFEPEARPAPR